MCFYCLCSVDILVWGVQAGSQTPKRHCLKTYSDYLGNSCTWKFSEEISSHIFFFFFAQCWFISICMFRLQILSIKLQLQSFNCSFSYSFLLSSSFCWWMERLLTIWQSTLFHQKYTNLWWNFTDHLHDLLRKEKGL